jgi:sulfite dehydrogenase (quinone) subunit SoeA
MSMLDRPISEFDGPADSVRVPVVPPKGECKPFQEVLIELAGRLHLPAFTRPDGYPRYRDYPDFIVHYETKPGSGVGFLSGWRGKDGTQSMKGEPNPEQWERYAANNCVHHYVMPLEHQYMRNWNRGYIEWARAMRLRTYTEPAQIQIYSEVMQEFRLAAQGRRPGRQPPGHLRSRIERYFDPLPFYYAPLESRATDLESFPLTAVTQRPMAMYHSWDSQNAWLRQIHSHNYLFVSPVTAQAASIPDGGWMWVESPWGKVRCMARYSEAVEPGTVWTWNAIGKQPGAWRLSPDANEGRQGFLLNHLITDELPLKPGSDPDFEHQSGSVGQTAHESGSDPHRISNSDPVTGQAGWYDVRVRIRPAEAHEPEETFPQFEAMPAMAGTRPATPKWLAYLAGPKR